MANATVPTLLNLDHYAEILGINPWHFNQIISPTEYPEVDACASIWFQYQWQDIGHASREELARAIAQAERRIARYIGFWPRPAWIEGEIQRYPRQRRSRNGEGRIFYPARRPERRKTIQTNWGYYADGGRRRVVQIELAATVSYSSAMGSLTFDDTATITSSYSVVLDPAEVAVFAGTDTSPENRIRNVNVSVDSSGNITITGRSAVFLDPALWNVNSAANGDLAVSYLTQVNLYRIYTSDEGNTYAPAEFAWQRSNLPSAFAAAYGTLQLWNPERGIITPARATWNASGAAWESVCETLTEEPHLVRIWYYAGWLADDQGRVDEPWARAIAALATALLMKPICGCGQSEKLAGYWQGIPTPTEGVSYEQLNCIFGPQRGAWEAYNTCKDHVDVGGASVGSISA